MEERSRERGKEEQITGGPKGTDRAIWHIESLLDQPRKQQSCNWALEPGFQHPHPTDAFVLSSYTNSLSPPPGLQSSCLDLGRKCSGLPACCSRLETGKFNKSKINHLEGTHLKIRFQLICLFISPSSSELRWKVKSDHVPGLPCLQKNILRRSPSCLISAGLRCITVPLSKITKQRPSTKHPAYKICMMMYDIIRPYYSKTSKQFQWKKKNTKEQPLGMLTLQIAVSPNTLAMSTFSDNCKLQSLGRKRSAILENVMCGKTF